MSSRGQENSSRPPNFSVALIGSSGGGTATLGHTNPAELIGTIHQELQKIEDATAGITSVAFVSLEGGKSFDNVIEHQDIASLHQVKTNKDHRARGCQIHISKTATLNEINTVCKQLDQEISALILSGKIHGVICISCSVDIFSKTLQSAAAKNLPVTGTGGTSLSLAASRYNIRLVGNAGGSVANTSLTRAVSYTHALSTDWKVSYRPWRHNDYITTSISTSALSVKSVLNACLPAFWGACLLKRCLESQMFLGDGTNNMVEALGSCITVLENHVLPAACAVVLATINSSQDSSSLIMASVLASSVCWRSILGGLLAGWIVPVWHRKMLFLCIVNNIPATMTNLVTSGGVGGITALFLLPIAPLLRSLTVFIRWAILQTVSSNFIIPPELGGFLWGCFCCYGSKVGWYHAVFLPLILIEMECGSPSFLGAIDELTLVLTCSGVCLGNLVFGEILCPKKTTLSEAELSLSKRAMYINLLCGDFVEACYPFMDKHRLINFGCYLGSGMSSAFLVMVEDEDIPLSSAYLPLPLSIWLSGSRWHRFALSSVIGLLVPFAFTFISHWFQMRSRLH